ncbi:MAG: phosphodiester glycosidase family protein [Muribaculaceae bacterium]
MISNLHRLILLFVAILISISVFATKKSEIIIQGTTYKVDTLQHFDAGHGSLYTSLKLTNEKGPLRAHIFEIDLKNPYVQIKTILAKDSTLTCETPSEMAKRKSTKERSFFAGINGDGFKISDNIGYPLNACVFDGQLARTTIPDMRPLIGLDKAKNIFMDYISYDGSVIVNGAKHAIDDINTVRNTDMLLFYNNLNGNYTHTNWAGTEALIELLPGNIWDVNEPLKFKVLKVISGKGNMKMGLGQAVLSGHGTAETFVQGFKAGDEGELSLNLNFKTDKLNPSLDVLMGGDRYILLDDAVVDNDWAELHPRTAIGYSRNKDKLYFCVVDGRYVNSVGVTTKQLADIMKYAGANYALNLDGGGSSCLYIKGFEQVNNPSDGKERGIGAGVFASSIAPEDNAIASIKFVDWAMNIPKYGVYDPVFYGYNKYGMLINTNVEGVVLSCPAGHGEIVDFDTLIGSANGTFALTGTYNGLTATIPVTVEESDNVAIRLTKVITDTYKEYPVEVQAIVKDTPMPIYPSALKWSIDDNSIATINPDNGVLKGLTNGETTVHGTVGTFNGSMKVFVEKPTARAMAIDSNLDPTTWKITQIGGKNMIATAMENGMKLVYTGASGRGPNIKLAKKIQLWSLPDTIRLRINPGDAPIKRITISTKANGGGTINSIVNTPDSNTLNIIDLKTSDWCDETDMQSYPLFLNYIQFEMDNSSIGKEYVIEIPGIEAIYKDVPLSLGVEDAVVDNALAISPNPVKSGDNVAISMTSESDATIAIHNAAGQLLKSIEVVPISGKAVISTAGLDAAIYFVTITQNGTKQTGKLIVE